MRLETTLLAWQAGASAESQESVVVATALAVAEVATVGQLVEDSLVKKFDIDFCDSDKALIDDEKNSKAAIFVDMFSGEIKGAIVLGNFAEHIINFFTLAINTKYSLFNLNSFSAPYPTYFTSMNNLYPKFIKEYSLNRLKYLFNWTLRNWLIIPAVGFLILAILYFVQNLPSVLSLTFYLLR